MIQLVLEDDGPTVAPQLLCRKCDAAPHWTPIWPCPGISFAGSRHLPVAARPPVPAETRSAAFRRAGYSCEDCGEEAKPLDVHHLNYLRVGWEQLDDLAVLCRNCHDARHHDLNGQYWRDPQAMEDAWATYHEEMSKPAAW